jgi:hypothetical protein
LPFLPREINEFEPLKGITTHLLYWFFLPSFSIRVAYDGELQDYHPIKPGSEGLWRKPGQILIHSSLSRMGCVRMPTGVLDQTIEENYA